MEKKESDKEIAKIYMNMLKVCTSCGGTGVLIEHESITTCYICKGEGILIKKPNKK